MFVPTKIVEYFGINIELVRNLQSELAVARAERYLLRNELLSTKINADWFRIKVNDLEAQNKALLNKAYNINVPVPEIIRDMQMTQTLPNQFSPFDDMGDEMAAKLGLPMYGK